MCLLEQSPRSVRAARAPVGSDTFLHEMDVLVGMLREAPTTGPLTIREGLEKSVAELSATARTCDSKVAHLIVPQRYADLYLAALAADKRLAAALVGFMLRASDDVENSQEARGILKAALRQYETWGNPPADPRHREWRRLGWVFVALGVVAALYIGGMVWFR